MFDISLKARIAILAVLSVAFFGLLYGHDSGNRCPINPANTCAGPTASQSAGPSVAFPPNVP